MWLKNNFWTFFCGLFALVGTIFGIVAYSSWSSTQTLKRKGVETVGTVEGFNRNRKGSSAPVIVYTTREGVEARYYSSTYSSPPAYDLGEEVKLWYMPNKPDDVVLSGIDSWLFPVIFGAFSVIFAGIGYGGLIGIWRKNRNKEKLKESGQTILADVVDVRFNASLRIGGKSPWVIVAQYFDAHSQKVYTYESDNIWYNPSPFLTLGQKIKVRVEPQNYAIYEVDISFLPSMGN